MAKKCIFIYFLNYIFLPSPPTAGHAASAVNFDSIQRGLKHRHGRKYFIKVVKEKKNYSFRDVLASLVMQVISLNSVSPEKYNRFALLANKV